MHASKPVQRIAWLCGGLAALACASPPEPTPDLLAPTAEQMKLRSFQTRTFDVASRNQAMRGVIAALQDLGFIIERANEPLGLVTAARFAEPRYYDVVGVTVTVRPQGDGQVMIRANAIFNKESHRDHLLTVAHFPKLNIVGDNEFFERVIKALKAGSNALQNNPDFRGNHEYIHPSAEPANAATIMWVGRCRIRALSRVSNSASEQHRTGRRAEMADRAVRIAVHAATIE